MSRAFAARDVQNHAEERARDARQPVLKSTNDAASYLRRKAQKNEGAAKILAGVTGSRVPKRTRRFDESDDEVLAEVADGGGDDDSGDDDGDESDDTKPERVGHL